jgi:hypothetical protein
MNICKCKYVVINRWKKMEKAKAYDLCLTYNVEGFLEVLHRQNSSIRMNQVSNSKIIIYR